jgi:hypothetical protein
MVSFDLWIGRAVTTILSPKFGDPAQRWGRGGSLQIAGPCPPGQPEVAPPGRGAACRATTPGRPIHGATVHDLGGARRAQTRRLWAQAGPGPTYRGLARFGPDLPPPSRARPGQPCP